MSEDNIKSIVDAYRDDNHHDGFARTFEISEIRENDFNLNVSLYVFPEEEDELIDIKKEWNELITVENDLIELNKKIEKHIQDLGYN